MTHYSKGRPVRAQYHLRYQILPAAQREETVAEAKALAKACQELEISEVVLLLGAEDVFEGHLAGAQEDRWYVTVEAALAVLTEAGLSVSLNPWATVGHADRGRVDRLGFSPMVSPTGQSASGQASFACPRWRRWMVNHYGRFAELGFRVVWLEDDFRFHNHAPLEWGGGFEPLMLERLAALVGEPVTRERVVAAVTHPGEPHPWRALLQQVWRTAQLEVAELVAAEVHRRSRGRSEVGLMSSRLDKHSVEGRDWKALFEALTVEGRATHRPHFAWYNDLPGNRLGAQLWLLEAQRALRPPAVRSEPEIENWPYTSWTKSDVQTWSEMTVAQFAGSDALLVNAYPNNERRVIERYPQVSGLLRRSRPALDWIAERYPRDHESWGVGVPFPPAAATHLRTRAGGDLSALEIDSGPAADYLLRNGIPVTSRPAPVNAVFGGMAWALSDEVILRLLGGGLLVDGLAAEVLCKRGFGSRIGVDVAAIVPRDPRPERGAQPTQTPYTGERAVEPNLARDLGLENSMLSLNVQPALARLEPREGATVWTEVLAGDGSRWGAGRTAFPNDIGGRVVVLAATAPDALAGSDAAQRLLHHTIRFLEGEHPAMPLVSGGPHLFPHLSRSHGTTRLAVANGSADPARVEVDIPRIPDRPSATLLRPLAAPVKEPVRAQGRILRHESELCHRGWLVLEWPEPVDD
ncbi:hypothetical protein KDK95_02420 [Actinospica sp. MGRD01-02]|uniref:Uncharacterized protein n=1 Tax=Actinospica acidithermotolerans TaxID=2828514 RepID=A0A941E7Z9_9ACTN|nr:hypothetical protein [Actinospica acidithermotolerans]MBR7825145.1 hypothetical protein [Actinospica acidithermotolerans]